MTIQERREMLEKHRQTIEKNFESLTQSIRQAQQRQAQLRDEHLKVIGKLEALNELGDESDTSEVEEKPVEAIQ